jgi:hypothetical protein
MNVGLGQAGFDELFRQPVIVLMIFLIHKHLQTTTVK